LRFVNSSASQTSFNITRQNLLQAYTFHIAGSTTNNVFSLYAAIRLKRVQVWSMPAVITTGTSSPFTEISLTWLSENAPDVEVVKGGTINLPAYITTMPPQGCLASFWTNTTSSNLSQNLFLMNLNGSDVVDIEFEYVPAAIGESLITSHAAFSSSGVSYDPLVTGLNPVGNITAA